jgi:hypothetical protein
LRPPQAAETTLKAALYLILSYQHAYLQRRLRNRPSWAKMGPTRGRGGVPQICAICRHKASLGVVNVDLQAQEGHPPTTPLA